MTQNKLYSLLLIACLAGFSYLFYHINTLQRETVRVCIFKNVTGYPCPSCGTTRAVTLLSQGKMEESLWVNPFGILVALIMTIFPLWMVLDVIFKKETLFKYYKKTEATIRKPWLASILILLVLLNWIWNIYKHL
jgi:phosphatidylserine synthase